MSVYHSDNQVTLHHGDCIDVMATLPDASVDSIVTDPPYGLGFMDRTWDSLPPGKEWAEQCLRVLRPGGHILAFGGTRTWHRLAVAIEDAGFDIRDSIAWMYSSGFPKSLDVSKAIDKAACQAHEIVGCTICLPAGAPMGVEREVIGTATGIDPAKARLGFAGPSYGTSSPHKTFDITAPATPEARRWDGWGTALKPAFEPVVVGRKALSPPTVAGNVVEHGVGAINIDGCRVGDEKLTARVRGTSQMGAFASVGHTPERVGRWPSNVILDEAQAEALDAARYFFTPKASQKERPRNADKTTHETVKPLALMRWLVRLVTPPEGTVLEPFAGSGTTVEACILETRRCIAIERDERYLPLIRKRVERRDDLFSYLINNPDEESA